MLNNISHLENASQNYETPLHTYQAGYNKKRQKQILTGMWKIGSLIH